MRNNLSICSGIFHFDKKAALKSLKHPATSEKRKNL